MGGVATKHSEYEDIEDRWERCRDASSGTDAVKAKGIKYLPALDSHQRDVAKYSEYQLRAMFYNATGRTIAGLSGGIFQKAPTIDDIDEKVRAHTEDITLTGEPLDMFALGVTREYLTTGRYGILVDMATAEAVEPRPYWVGYKAEDIVNWRFQNMGGDQELVLAVLREYKDSIDPKDEFAIDQVIQYRVLRLSDDGIYSQQLYVAENPKAGETEIKYVASGQPIIPLRKGTPLDFIPFSLPWSVMSPPLIDLADVNLSHFRGTADLKHGLHFTALPTPWVSGLSGGGQDKLSIGSGTAWSLDVNGRAGMLEFSGKGLGAIRQDLIDMQRQMATLGARLLEEAPHYAETALSVSMRHSSDYATLRTIAQIVEQQISWTLKVHCWWVGVEKLVSDLKARVELNKIFYDQQVTAEELRALLLALQGSAISYETFYQRLSNTGWMRDGVTADEELTAIKKDGDQFKKAIPTPAGVPASPAPAKPKPDAGNVGV